MRFGQVHDVATVAQAVIDALLESGERTVTSLDGDVVRRNLSAGLTFSSARGWRTRIFTAFRAALASLTTRKSASVPLPKFVKNEFREARK